MTLHMQKLIVRLPCGIYGVGKLTRLKLELQHAARNRKFLLSTECSGTTRDYASEHSAFNLGSKAWVCHVLNESKDDGVSRKRFDILNSPIRY